MLYFLDFDEFYHFYIIFFTINLKIKKSLRIGGNNSSRTRSYLICIFSFHLVNKIIFLIRDCIYTNYIIIDNIYLFFIKRFRLYFL